MEKLKLQAEGVEFHYDENDTNAINFLVEGGYLSLQIGVYVDPCENPPSTEPHIELDSQEKAQYGGIGLVVFYPDKLTINFSKKFLKKYDQVEILVGSTVDKKIVDFFVNHLFMGDRVEYSGEFPRELHVEQTEFQERLDEE
jgi:CRISPR/Cas system-associated protein endoribonuclease Cas2